MISLCCAIISRIAVQATVTQLPPTKTVNYKIVVFVDNLSKMVRFVAVSTAFGAYDMARLYLHIVIRGRGEILSYRDTLFTSTFWAELTASLV